MIFHDEIFVARPKSATNRGRGGRGYLQTRGQANGRGKPAARGLPNGRGQPNGRGRLVSTGKVNSTDKPKGQENGRDGPALTLSDFIPGKYIFRVF